MQKLPRIAHPTIPDIHSIHSIPGTLILNFPLVPKLPSMVPISPAQPKTTNLHKLVHGYTTPYLWTAGL